MAARSGGHEPLPSGACAIGGQGYAPSQLLKWGGFGALWPPASYGGGGGGGGVGGTPPAELGCQGTGHIPHASHIPPPKQNFGYQPQTLEGEAGGGGTPPPPAVYGRSNTSLPGPKALESPSTGHRTWPCPRGMRCSCGGGGGRGGRAWGMTEPLQSTAFVDCEGRASEGEAQRTGTGTGCRLCTAGQCTAQTPPPSPRRRTGACPGAVCAVRGPVGREENCSRGWGWHGGPFPNPPPSLAHHARRGGSARGVPYLPCRGGGDLIRLNGGGGVRPN